MRLRIVLRAALVAVATLGIMSSGAPAHATTAASMRILSVSPASSAALSGSTTIRAQQDLGSQGVTGPILAFRASNRSTRFYWDPSTSAGRRPLTAVTRNTFVARRPAYSYARIDWVWKSDSRGRRYRYATRVIAGDYRSADPALGGTLLALRDGEPWSVRADGTGARRLLSGTSFSRMSVSPDGRYVVATIAAQPGYPASALDLWDTSTGQVRRIASAGDSYELRMLDWSPDGSTVLYCDAGGTLRLYDVAEGAALATVMGQSAAFSPDGRTFAWVKEMEGDPLLYSVVGLYDIASTTSRVLATSEDDFEDFLVDAGPVWDRGGTSFLLSAAAEGSPNSGIWRVHADTGAVTRLGLGGWVSGVSGDGTRILASKHTYIPGSGSWDPLGFWVGGSWKFVPAGSATDYYAEWDADQRSSDDALVLTRSASETDVYVANPDGTCVRRILRGYRDARWWPGR